MTITAIKPAVKTRGRYNIFVDGTYCFSLSEQQLLDEKLTSSQQLSETRLAELKNQSDKGKKYARALDLISRRPRSEKEVRDWAWRKQWEDEVTNEIVELLKTKGYVNDESFARSWVRSRAILKNISHRKLRLELKQKGVSGDIIEAVIADSEDYDEAAALAGLIAKKKHRYADSQKLMSYLMRQGFSYGDIKEALKNRKR